MHVVNVNMTLDRVSGGGTAARTWEMSRFLARNGVETVMLGTVPAQEAAPKGLDGVRAVALPCIWPRFYIPRVSWRTLRDVVRGADIIHLMGHWSILNVFVYLCARRFGKPYVVCPAGALFIYGRSRRLKRIYDAMIGRSIVRKATAHIAVTVQETHAFEAYGVAARDVTVIPNGIDVEAYSVGEDPGFRSRYGLGDGPFILFMGRLNEIKGPDLLLEAFGGVAQPFRDYGLVFCGADEGMLPRLRMTARHLGIEERVWFLGYVGGVDKVRLYHGADFVVVPSRHESMSIVVLEAGAAGTPALLTDRCGFNEIEAIDGGRVVSASVEGLRTGLTSMLSDPGGLKRMGQNLKSLVAKRFSWDTIVWQYISLYRDILASRTSGSSGPP